MWNRVLLSHACLLWYVQVLASVYGFTDIYNGCLFRLLLRHNNTGPPDAVLYDMPLGWWDHDWKGCFNSRCATVVSSPTYLVYWRSTFQTRACATTRVGFTAVRHCCHLIATTRQTNAHTLPLLLLLLLLLGAQARDIASACTAALLLLLVCRKNISDTKWREVATHYLGMHNR
jgi:hypothetical protein